MTDRSKYDSLEVDRQKLQAQLDSGKSKSERNIRGQFATPIQLAKDILQHAKSLTSSRSKVKFLDPAFGTGSFLSALLSTFPSKRIEKASGFEIDRYYGKPASKLWKETILELKLCDFTKEKYPEGNNSKYNLIICNPPYVRHHHIVNGDKVRLKAAAEESSGAILSGLAGLYCYFLAISHRWLSKNGIAGWLIPSEFMDVNYGRELKKYLLNEVTLLQIHRFDPNDVQFEDALVSSAVVWIKNKSVPARHKVSFTYGGSLDNPSICKNVSIDVLRKEDKWTRFPLLKERINKDIPRINHYFTIKRGIATGNNKYFILSKEDIRKGNLPLSQFKPILPSPRFLNQTIINSDRNGYPIIDKKLFVLDCKLPFDVIKNKYPELRKYLDAGIVMGVPEGYLCKRRKPWYSQETRLASHYYCTYIGRSDRNGRKPFRFILNHSQAIVANSYLILYPKPAVAKAIQDKPELAEQILSALNQITTEAMLDEGRVYGGGLHNLEPRELSNLPATTLNSILGSYIGDSESAQQILFNK